METMKWLQSVYAFMKVNEYESFSKAAESLGVSKSHVSKLVRQLEDDLGAALFSRSTRSLALTSRGEIFLQNCSPSLESLEGAKREVYKLSPEPRGRLKVSMAGVFGEKFCAPVLMSMSKKFPKLEIQANFDDQMVDVIKDGYDLAIRFGALRDSNLIGRKIASRKEFICASPKYLSKHPRPKNIEDLKSHNLLGRNGERWILIGKGGQKVSVEVRGNFKSNNARVLHQGTLEGVGIVKLPGSYVFNDIQQGKLVPLLESYTLDQNPIWAVTPSKNRFNKNVEHFLSEMEKAMAKDYADALF